MTDQLPAPLLPAEIDMRDYPEFPLEFTRLFKSDTWKRWNDRQRVVGLRLWCESWHQEPCATLPNQDSTLADLAGYGESPEGLRAWLKIKDSVLTGGGWMLCSDGRWHHPVVAEKAIDKWRTKRRKVKDNAADAERKRLKRLAEKNARSAGQPEMSGAASAGHTADVHPDKRASEEEGKRTGREDPPSEGAAAPPALAGDLLDIPLCMIRIDDGDWSKPLFRQALAWLAERAGKPPNALRGFVGKCLKAAGDNHKRVFDLVAQAQSSNIAEPQAWLIANLESTNGASSFGSPRRLSVDEQRRQNRADILEGLGLRPAAGE